MAPRLVAPALLASLLLTLTATAAPSRVLVTEVPTADLASVTVLFGLDAWQVPNGREGLPALYTELAMFEMSKGLDEGAAGAAGLRDHLPGQRGIDVARRRDYLAITVNTTTSGLPAAVHFLLHYVLDAKFTQAELDLARRNVLKRRDAWAASVIEPTEQLLVRAMWDGCVGVDPFGKPEGIKKVSLEDVQEYVARMVTRDNTWLAVVAPAGVMSKELRQEAEQALAALPASPRQLKPPRLGLGGRVVVEGMPGLDRASLAVGASLPPFGTREHWAGRLIREMLASPGGRLEKDRGLLGRLGLLLPPGMSWRQLPVTALPVPFGRCSYLAVYAICYPARIEVARQGLVRELAALADGQFTDAELDRARLRVANLWAQDMAAPRDLARMTAVAAMLGTKLPRPPEVAATVADVTHEDVAAAAAGLLHRLSVGVELPQS
ncbi:MAG: insulinase family protein [Armatimonadetes bacterium]|nr:insulinase family protein [Armatimonadota bacterium]